MYQHTQSGTVTRLAALGGLVVASFLLVRIGARPVLWVLLIVALLGVVAMSSLTVEVDHERFRFWFGPGCLGRSFPLSDIRSWTAVRNPWWYGWGIHLTPRGWLYNVGGRGAVELELADGGRLRVGSDEPERLCEAIDLVNGGHRRGAV